MKLKTQRQIQSELIKTKKDLTKESFKELLIKIADITSNELINETEDEYHSLSFLYNVTRVFLFKHFDYVYKEDYDLLDEFSNSPDILFGLKDGSLEQIMSMYEQYVNNETMDVSLLDTYEINLISDVVEDTYISCYTEYFKGNKEDANKRGEELKELFDCQICRITKYVGGSK